MKKQFLSHTFKIFLLLLFSTSLKAQIEFQREFSTVANTSYLSLSGNIVTTTSQYSVQPDYSALWYYNINGQPSGNFGYYWNMRLAGTVTATNGEKFMIQNNQIAHYYSNGQLAGMYNGPHHWSFNSPDAIVQDPSSGEIYVTDGGRVIRLFATDWFGVGNIQDARGIAVSEDYVFVSDVDGIEIFDKSNGTWVSQLGSNFSPANNLLDPKDITFDKGVLYVADAGHNRIATYIPGIAPNFEHTFLSSFNGTEHGRGSYGQLNQPFGVRVSPSGEIFVSDQGNNRIQVFKEVVCPTTEEIYIQTDQFTSNGSPNGIAFDQSGFMYVCGHLNDVIYKYDQAHNLIQTIGSTYNDETRKLRPGSVCVDLQGNIFALAGTTGTIVKFNSNGNYLGSSQVNNLSGGLAYDQSGNIFATSGTQLFKFNNNLGKTDEIGSTGHGFGNLEFSGARGVATDINGNVLVADRYGIIRKFNNNLGFVQRWIDPNQYVNNRWLNKHDNNGFAIDNQNNMFYIDMYGSNAAYDPKIFKYCAKSPTIQIMATIIPNSNYLYPGWTDGIAIDANNDVWVSCSDNTIRKFSKSSQRIAADNSLSINSLNASPNPASNDFNLSFIEGGDHEIIMYNSTGAEVLRKSGNGSEVNISDPALGNGLYTIHATSNGVVNKTKVVIAK